MYNSHVRLENAMTDGEPCTFARTNFGGLAPTNRRRVSDREPSTGSTTVRRRTPLIRPMFKNMVGRFLSIEVSKISAKQMDDGGAVNAYGSADPLPSEEGFSSPVEIGSPRCYRAQVRSCERFGYRTRRPSTVFSAALLVPRRY